MLPGKRTAPDQVAPPAKRQLRITLRGNSLLPVYDDDPRPEPPASAPPTHKPPTLAALQQNLRSMQKVQLRVQGEQAQMRADLESEQRKCRDLAQAHLRMQGAHQQLSAELQREQRKNYSLEQRLGLTHRTLNQTRQALAWEKQQHAQLFLELQRLSQLDDRDMRACGYLGCGPLPLPPSTPVPPALSDAAAAVPPPVPHVGLDVPADVPADLHAGLGSPDTALPQTGPPSPWVSPGLGADFDVGAGADESKFWQTVANLP